jgi:hypothetical protein
MRPPPRVLLALLTLFGVLHGSTATSETVSLPLDALEAPAREKIEALLKDHTLKRSPTLDHAILNRPLHHFLMDRPDVGAALSRILKIGTYTVTRTGTDQFRASDPEGLEGDLEILYRDEARRVYFAQGTAEGRLLKVQGKALVLNRSQYRTTDQGQQWVTTDLTIYAKIENPFLAFFLKIFSPLIGGMVDAKLSKAQGVVRQVCELMVQDPQGTYARIAESEELAPEDLTALQELMMSQIRQKGIRQKGISTLLAAPFVGGTTPWAEGGQRAQTLSHPLLPGLAAIRPASPDRQPQCLKLLRC